MKKKEERVELTLFNNNQTIEDLIICLDPQKKSKLNIEIDFLCNLKVYVSKCP